MVKMYRDQGNIVVEEDEQVYGENLELVDKKNMPKTVPYSDVFD